MENITLVSDADIDFLSHYRLVDPSRIDTYARAFVVEDSDLDTVINSNVSSLQFYYYSSVYIQLCIASCFLFLFPFLTYDHPFLLGIRCEVGHSISPVCTDSVK